MPDTNDERIKEEALAFARRNKDAIASELTSLASYPAEAIPVWKTAARRLGHKKYGWERL